MNRGDLSDESGSLAPLAGLCLMGNGLSRCRFVGLEPLVVDPRTVSRRLTNR